MGICGLLVQTPARTSGNLWNQIGKNIYHNIQPDEKVLLEINFAKCMLLKIKMKCNKYPNRTLTQYHPICILH